LAQQRILVDGIIASDSQQSIGPFNRVVLDANILQDSAAVYYMLNKPKNIVCATSDDKHKTVLELISQDISEQQHIDGRLDLNSTGLVLLTNDGKWSKALSSPTSNVHKQYLVDVENSLSSEYISAFTEGMYFAYENITTKPAKLQIISEKKALVILSEGRYHQIKRMFGRFRNPVLSIHRIAIGSLNLCEHLLPGHYRPLSQSELCALEFQIKP
jgi:16S rRNA pseudouridine516 synthase